MKKLVSILLVLTVLFGAFSIFAFAEDGSGITAISKDVSLIKTAIYGQKLKFSDSDFKSALVITDFDKLTITKLPSSLDGTLLLAGRRVKEGQAIKRRNVGALVFVPASTEVKSAQFYFKVDNCAGGNEIVCNIKFIDKVNYAPSIDEGTSASALVTQAQIPLYARLSATDPEGDKLEYIIVSYPAGGRVDMLDKETGRYSYTPDAEYTGYDKFSYVVRDEYGNYTKPCEVSIKVIERMSEKIFADMTKRSEYNAAVAMEAMGIMSAYTYGDGLYFNPDATVSKAEFLAMAMKAYGIKPKADATSTFFDDTDNIPKALIGYVARASEMGIIDGTFDGKSLSFEPERAIKKSEAAGIMSNIMNRRSSEEEEVFVELSDIPVWARSYVMAMYTMGIFDYDEESVYVDSEVTRAEAAEYIYRMVKSK